MRMRGVRCLVAAAGLGLAAAAAGAADIEHLFAKVIVNLVELGDRELVLQDGEFWLPIADVSQIGLVQAPPRQTNFGGVPFASLGSIAGAKVVFDPQRVVLHLTVDSSQIQLTESKASGKGGGPPRPHGDLAAHVNYAINQRFKDSPSVAVEAAVSQGPFRIESSAATVSDAQGSGVRHLGSTAYYEDMDRRQVLAAGNVDAQGWTLGPGARLRGISLRSNFGMEPDLRKEPSYGWAGAAQYPSELDVFMDGQKVRTEKVQPGSFSIAGLSGAQGAHSFQYVLRDPFGREQRYEQSVYFTDQLLRAGLHEYEYSAGRLIHPAGQPQPADDPVVYSGHHRWAPTDTTTLAAHAVMAGARKMIGVSGISTLGTHGVADFALARSRHEAGSGSALRLGYQYNAPDWSVAANMLRADSGYDPVTPFRRTDGERTERNVTGFLSLTPTLRLSAGYGFLRAPGQGGVIETSSAWSLNGSLSVRPGMQAQASLKRLSGPRPDTQLTLTLTFLDAPDLISAGFRRQKSGDIETARASRSTPIGEGWGYDVSAERSAPNGARPSLAANGTVQLNHSLAALRGTLQSQKSGGTASTTGSLSLAGSIGMVGGRFFAGRPLTSAFAVVDVAGYQDIEVLVDGQKRAQTGLLGVAVIPDIGPYRKATIAVDPGALPPEQVLDKWTAGYTPYARGGVLLKFAPRLVQTFTGRILLREGSEGVPLAFKLLQMSGAGEGSVETGRRGEFYLENIAAGAYTLRATLPTGVCELKLEVPKSSEALVELGRHLCVPLAAEAPKP